MSRLYNFRNGMQRRRSPGLTCLIGLVTVMPPSACDPAQSGTIYPNSSLGPEQSVLAGLAAVTVALLIANSGSWGGSGGYIQPE